MKDHPYDSAALRQQYEDERWPANARVMRAAALSAMVLNPIGGLTDYAISGATATTYTIVALRVIAACLHIPILRDCLRDRPSPGLERWIIAGFVATAISGVLAPTLLRPTSVASQGGPLLLLVVLWSLLFPAWRTRKSTVFLLVSAAYVAIGYYWRPLIGYGGQHELITVSIFLVALAILLPKVYARFESTEKRLFTAQKGLEQTVLRLEDEVDLRRAREISLRNAREQAEAASAAKGEFLANVSHELRTPLVGILGVGELLLDADLPTRQHRRVELLQQSGQLLLGLVNDLLDFSKLEAGRLPIERIPVAVARVFGHVCQLLQRRADEKGIWLRLEIDPGCTPWVLADPLRLEQILLNLVSNAIRFTDSGGVEIRANTHTGEDGRGRLKFAVKDTGVGIDEEDLERIFDPFEQAAKSTARKFGGTGLGLSITQRLVERLGGKISVQSQVGTGTEFTVEIVADATSVPVKERVAVPIDEGTSLRILLGEDNPVNSLVLTALLRSLGHSVEVAKDGAALVDAAARGGHDLILTDIQMPILDGVQAARKIRESGHTGPILALTADVSGSAQSEDFDAVLPKPIAREALQKALMRYCSKKRSPRLLSVS